MRYILLSIALILSLQLGSQTCNRLARKSVKEIAPFKFNGQLNKVVLSAGESAELSVVLKSNKKYRILVSGGRLVGDLNFKLYDRNKKLVFDNAKHDMAQSWDFIIQATQQYFIEVTYPGSDDGYKDYTNRGCVALVIGSLDNN